MSRPHGTILKASDFQIHGKHVVINPNKTGRVQGMLLIFATWCGHCHTFLPTFNNISDTMGDGYCCASIESEELKGQDSLNKALDFQGFPTICFFNKNGVIVNKYNGARDKKDILDNICKNYHHCVRNNY